MTSSDTCYHCGLPNTEADKYVSTILGEDRQMCCPGCKAVADAIVANGLEDYYSFRTEPAVQGDALLNETLDKLKIYDEEAIQEDFVYDEGTDKSIQLTIEGITCAACGWLIEKQLARVDGIKQVSVNVQERRAIIVWTPTKIALSRVLALLKRIGYNGMPFQPEQHEQAYQREQKAYLKKLGLAGLMTMQVMMLMTGLYFDWFGNIEQETKRYFYWVALVLTTPVVLYSGSSFYLGAIKALSARTMNMDVPVTIAIAGTYIAGLHATVFERGEVYFESICMFIFLLLLSRFLEHRARHRAAQISANMTHYIPVSASKISDDGSIAVCLAKQLKIDDEVLVKAGEVIPVDGVILSGKTDIDESMLTGEFQPVNKAAGATVYGGTINRSGAVQVKVTRTLKHALVNQIVRLQAQAMADKPRIALFADRISTYFVSAVLLIAAATYTYWRFINPSPDAFWIVISVLVATCPCALGLATPSALTCAVAKLNKNGLLLKRADILEQVGNLSVIALDKTGTLTQGKFSIVNAWYSDNVAKTQIDSITMSLESRSEHPIAQAFSEGKTRHVDDFEVMPGGGIAGTIDGVHYKMGSRNFCSATLPDSVAFEPNVVLTQGDTVLAAFKLSDTVKQDTKQALNALLPMKLVLLSGDTQSNVDDIAQLLPVERAVGGLSPEDKYQQVKQMQQQGEKVMMLGDGINDAPVLSSADISVAVGNATDIAKNAADVILLSDHLTSLEQLITIARQTTQIIRQNLLWAIAYNVVILPFAVSGALSPWMAVIGMSLSSLIVVSNSTRLLR